METAIIRRTITLYMMHFLDNGETIEFFIEAYRAHACMLADSAPRAYTTWEQAETVH